MLCAPTMSAVRGGTSRAAGIAVVLACAWMPFPRGMAAESPAAGDKPAAEAPGPAEGATKAALAKAAAPDARKKPVITLRLRAEYDVRSQGDDRDSDLYGYLYGGVRDLNDGRLDVYVSGRLHSDLDESEASSSDADPFWSLDDSDGVTERRLLQAYADLHDRAGRLSLRGGRQYVEIADYLHLDGGQVAYREQERLGGRVYVGRPVSYYTSVSGDLAAGLSLVGRPWTGNRTRLTFAHYRDDSEDGSDRDYFLDMQQNFSDEMRARGQVSFLNDEFRMGRLDLFFFSDDGKTDLALGGSHWGRFDARTRAYSPLYRVLGEQEPYSYAYVRLTQQIVPTVFLSPGASARFAGSGDNDANNRDYRNCDLTLTYEPVRAFSASVSLQYWDVDAADSFLGVAWEARYRHRRVWEVSAGAAYAQYTYDSYSDISYSVNGGQTVFSENGTVVEKSPYVYTYFVRARWNLTRHLAVRIQFDIEDDQAASDLAFRGRGSLEVRL
ncbi:MAG: hypothetical protein KJ579_05575 [Verrucomicrobia bacterium]|nr:hypothetical protein [Verrucomicrobiota bacterium]